LKREEIEKQQEEEARRKQKEERKLSKFFVTTSTIKKATSRTMVETQFQCRDFLCVDSAGLASVQFVPVNDELVRCFLKFVDTKEPDKLYVTHNSCIESLELVTALEYAIHDKDIVQITGSVGSLFFEIERVKDQGTFVCRCPSLVTGTHCIAITPFAGVTQQAQQRQKPLVKQPQQPQSHQKQQQQQQDDWVENDVDKGVIQPIERASQSVQSQAQAQQQSPQAQSTQTSAQSEQELGTFVRTI